VVPSSTACGFDSYNTGTSTLSWHIDVPAVTAATTLQLYTGTASRNCPFIYYASMFQGQPTNPQCAVPGGITTGDPAFAYQILATSIAGACGALPRGGATSDQSPVICNLPANSAASTISMSAVITRQCSEFVVASPFFFMFPSPFGGGGFLAVPGSSFSIPADLSLCPAVVIPPVTQPAAPTPVPGAPTATPTQVLAPVPLVIPQVFQNPGAQGIFNGPRNSATPRPAVAVAPAVASAPSAMPVLRPPSTGDAGLAFARRSE